MTTRPRLLLQACLLTLLTTQAYAHKWDGFYAGAGIGGIRSKMNTDLFVEPGGLYFDYIQDAQQIRAVGDDEKSQWNFVSGLFGGYGRQYNSYLIGVEAGINSLSINNSVSTTQPYNSLPSVKFTLSQTLTASLEGTLRLRLGKIIHNWLAYVTGGGAMTRIKYTSNFSDNNINPGTMGARGTAKKAEMKYGWSLGAGAEYALNDAWAAKLEYVYTRYGDVGTSYTIFPTPGLAGFNSTLNGKAKLATQTVMAGLVYNIT